jgi:hypothetical protein
MVDRLWLRRKPKLREDFAFGRVAFVIIGIVPFTMETRPLWTGGFAFCARPRDDGPHDSDQAGRLGSEN